MLLGIYIGITLCVLLFNLFFFALAGGKGFEEVIFNTVCWPYYFIKNFLIFIWEF
jgi:hypothetical protein